jgi:hypothetical protein
VKLVGVTSSKICEDLAKLRRVKMDGGRLGDRVNSSIHDLRVSLARSEDNEPAETLHVVTRAASQFDELIRLRERLTPESRKSLASVFVAFRPTLEELFTHTSVIPGVGPEVQSKINTIRLKFNTLGEDVGAIKIRNGPSAR